MTTKFAGIGLFILTLVITIGYRVYSKRSTGAVNQRTLVVLAIVLLIYTTSTIIMWQTIGKSDDPEVNRWEPINYVMFGLTYCVLGLQLFLATKNLRKGVTGAMAAKLLPPPKTTQQPPAAPVTTQQPAPAPAVAMQQPAPVARPVTQPVVSQPAPVDQGEVIEQAVKAGVEQGVKKALSGNLEPTGQPFDLSTNVY